MFKELKVIFMGTPFFSVPTLEMLIEKTNVILVVSQPDKIVGRKKELTNTPVKSVALKHDIEIFQPNKIKDNYQRIKELNPDIIITAAYGQIVPKEVLDIPRLGCINIHGSILPKYRGAAPIQWSIINGDKETGITLMYMDETMDTGNIIDVRKIPISEDDNLETVFDKMSILGSELLKDNLNDIVNKTNKSISQDHDKATYAKMIKREDELIDFDDATANIYNKIRGIYPNAYTIINGDNVKILKTSYKLCKVNESGIIIDITKSTFGITTNDGIIFLEVVKPSGKNMMDIKNYLNGINKGKLLNTKVG